MKHIVLLIFLFFTAPVAFACTGFTKEVGGDVYFAANEDWFNPYTRIWTVSGDDDNFGLLIMGFSDMFPQTIINDQGLAMDGFATGVLEVKDTRGKKTFKGNLFLEVLKKCASVEEALAMISEYNLEFLSEAQILIGDKTGDSALIEGDVIHRKEGSYQVATNFYLSKTDNIICSRYNQACQLLDDENVTDEVIRTVLQRTRQYLTQYSYIYNLTKGTMELFFFGDFETSRTFNINEELNQKPYNIEMHELFENDSYNLYLSSYNQKKPQKLEEPIRDISKYTGYYYISSMKTGYEVFESDGTLKVVIDGIEFQMIPSENDIFFFENIDYIIQFQKDSSTKIYGFNVKHSYLHFNEFAKKINPIWSWIYKLWGSFNN